MSATPSVRILITGALHPDAIDSFQKEPTFVVEYAPDLPRDELLKKVADVHVLVTRSETAVDREVIASAPALKVIARAAVGVANIDIGAASERGILVVNCPGKNTNSAAELTIGLALAMLRKIPQAHQTIKGGGWDRHRFSGRELRGKKIGIVGLGNVGHRVAKFAHGFDMEVYAYDPYIAPAIFQRHDVKRCDDLGDLAERVDVLSVHVPLNKETRGMVDEAVLARMKPGSYVVNAARGGVVQEEALLGRLNDGHIAGAGIDTWEHEPTPLKALVEHSHVWCSPHIGATTLEAQAAIGRTVFEQVQKAVGGGVVDYPVNLPKIGAIENPLLKPYSVLAEKLGSLISQVIDFNPSSMEVNYRGDLASADPTLVRLGLMKGYSSHVVDGYVSFVNAEAHFDKLGIELKESEDPGFNSYKSALKVRIVGPNSRELVVGGIVFDGKYPRLSLFNSFTFELEPRGDLLIVENEDRPGVIGDVGHFLAKSGINIDSFALSRNQQGGKAMAMIRTDEALGADQVTAMRKINNVISVRSAQL